MNLYEYKGPVMEFGRCIANRWEGTTRAASERKAKSNLAFQYKKENNKIPATKIELPGQLVLVG